jgi:hypothetical protein
MNKVVEIKDDLMTSEREAIERAVEAYVAQHRRSRASKNMFDLVGEVRLRDDYDYKALRAGDA